MCEHGKHRVNSSESSRSRRASSDFMRRFYEKNADALDASLLESAKEELAKRGIYTVEQLRQDRKRRGFEF